MHSRHVLCSPAAALVDGTCNMGASWQAYGNVRCRGSGTCGPPDSGRPAAAWKRKSGRRGRDDAPLWGARRHRTHASDHKTLVQPPNTAAWFLDGATQQLQLNIHPGSGAVIHTSGGHGTLGWDGFAWPGGEPRACVEKALRSEHRSRLSAPHSRAVERILFRLRATSWASTNSPWPWGMHQKQLRVIRSAPAFSLQLKVPLHPAQRPWRVPPRMPMG